MSSQLHPQTLDELLHRGRYLFPTDVVDVVERFHATEGPGVPRSVITAYVSEVLGRLGRRAPYSVQRFESLLERRVTDLDMWIPKTVYVVAPGRVSVYPPRWHTRLTGVTDPAEYVVVIGRDLAAARGADATEPLPPVPRPLLVDAMMVLGGVDRPTAASLLRDAHHGRRIRVEPVQNPNAYVWVTDPDLWRQPETTKTDDGRAVTPTG
ncbi:hypothetical protein VB779_17120 [Haloarculaceae archaeon H-GB11]|nr:hypothetical protein [Haloarculaceae archaeon H-GB11]